MEHHYEYPKVVEVRRNHTDEAIAAIDNGLREAASITIDSALDAAIASGQMTIKEAEECREAYYQNLNAHEKGTE